MRGPRVMGGQRPAIAGTGKTPISSEPPPCAQKQNGAEDEYQCGGKESEDASRAPAVTAVLLCFETHHWILPSSHTQRCTHSELQHCPQVLLGSPVPGGPALPTAACSTAGSGAGWRRPFSDTRPLFTLSITGWTAQ